MLEELGKDLWNVALAGIGADALVGKFGSEAACGSYYSGPPARVS